jgi:hypothetical protein
MLGPRLKLSSPRSRAKAVAGLSYPSLLAALDDVFAFSEGEPTDAAPPPKESVAPGRGTFFDEYIDIRDPEGAAFTARILDRYDEVRPRKRRRGRDALTTRIRKVLANAMRASYYRNRPSVLYFRKADASWYADKPSWMKHGALGEVVDALADAGLVRTITGKKMPYGSETPSWASSYTPTDQLTRLAADCGVSADSIDRRLPSEVLVRLFGRKPKREFDWERGVMPQPRKGKPISFEPTAETQEWTARLEAINAFYRQQVIGLGLAPHELTLWLEERNADPERTGASYRMPELFKTDIYRVFNNGEEANPSFNDGGRLFGGWWMSIAEGLRKAITINGQPTVELDYRSCHPRMLYHRKGLDCEGDLYDLPEIAAYEEASGVAPGTYRGYVKWLMQVLINCRGRPRAAEKPDQIAEPPGLSAKKIIAFIEARHQPIADTFKTGAGMQLMRLESDIALEIISEAMAEGWPVLSIHDSFIAPLEQAGWLKAMMIDAYVRRLGRVPSIKNE